MNDYHFVYILERKDNKYYIGMTSNIGFRFKQHLNGKVASTKNLRPLKLIYIEIFNSKKEAYRRETQIKNWKSHKMIKDLINSTE